ncbi:unnamed protein product [Protopolystoma xenopodis]|uniref:Uncharacterized protein n=1 Tax=Protopolystoma xenopodis TaxID=117903 RepID=A0A448X2L9_9PLAT|nr:unnamed protein product [Protopolystoma xenopodis]
MLKLTFCPLSSVSRGFSRPRRGRDSNETASRLFNWRCTGFAVARHDSGHSVRRSALSHSAHLHVGRLGRVTRLGLSKQHQFRDCFRLRATRPVQSDGVIWRWLELVRSSPRGPEDSSASDDLNNPSTPAHSSRSSR